MIYDCCLYNGENDLAKIRFEEMKSLDVLHVLVELPHTFSGVKKDMFYWLPKYGVGYNVLWAPLFEAELYVDPWQNEKYLRNSIALWLMKLGAKPNDTIIISDIDEIPRASAIKDWNGEYAALMMDKFGFWLNCREGKQNWHRARIMKYSYLLGKTPEEIRNSGFPEQIDSAGWHFSWQGGIDEVMRKFASFSHQEEGVQKHANREELMRKIAEGESLWGSDKWTIVPIDDTFPKYVQEHQHDTLKHLIYAEPNL